MPPQIVTQNRLFEQSAFEFMRTEGAREADGHPCIRVHLLANYEKMSSHVTVDVTTSDRIAKVLEVRTMHSVPALSRLS